MTIVVASRPPTPRELAAAQAADTCRTSGAGPIAARGPVGTSSRSSAALEPQPASEPRASGAGKVAHEASILPRAQALGAQFSKSAGLGATRLLLVAVASLAILLLGLASLPAAALAEPRLAALVETRRIELALAGASTLLAAVLVYLAAAG